MDFVITNYIFVMTCHDFFSSDFVNKLFLTPFKHDVHACVFLMMYMFVNCIRTTNIETCIHQGLNPRLHGNTLRSSPSNHFNTL